MVQFTAKRRKSSHYAKLSGDAEGGGGAEMSSVDRQEQFQNSHQMYGSFEAGQKTGNGSSGAIPKNSGDDQHVAGNPFVKKQVS